MNDKLDTQVLASRKFSDTAKFFGELFRTQGDSTQTGLQLVQELQLLGSSRDFANNEDQVSRHFKIGLAIGIFVASRPPENQQAACRETFGKLLLDPDSPLCEPSRLLLLTELCYMDQFVAAETRQWINKEFGHLLDKQPWSPSIRDYLHAWKKGQMYIKSKVFIGIKRESPKPRLYLLLSGKGGSGKSTTAAALVHHLHGQGKKVGIIDLDESGPSTQYSFSIKEVIEGLNEIPSETHKESIWCYPTFLDVLRAALADTDDDDIRRAKMTSAASRAVLASTDLAEVYFVLMPESPTFCADVAEYWGRDCSKEIIDSLNECIGALSERGCEDIVIDFAPGLYGTNGAIVKWLSICYHCSPIVLTSPRVSDIAVSIYEAPWLAAKYEFEWESPLLHIVNRWQHRKPCLEVISNWADQSVQNAIAASIGVSGTASSATQIQSKRFWPIMYQLGLDKDRGDEQAVFEQTHVLAHLPEDNKVRLLTTIDSDFSERSGRRIEMGDLEDTEWYKAFVALFTRYLAE